jgi:hypothetical protein
MPSPSSLLAPFKRAFPNYKIISTIRSEKHANDVRKAGVDEVIITSFEELNKLRDVASRADIVFNGANSDD